MSPTSTDTQGKILRVAATRSQHTSEAVEDLHLCLRRVPPKTLNWRWPKIGMQKVQGHHGYMQDPIHEEGSKFSLGHFVTCLRDPKAIRHWSWQREKSGRGGGILQAGTYRKGRSQVARKGSATLQDEPRQSRSPSVKI